MKRIAIAGASHRALEMYAIPIAQKYGNIAQIVGVYDINPMRSQVFERKTNGAARVYTDFDMMLKETKPDYVLVTTVDKFHHEYAIRAMESGCDVICEKPMTIDAEKCKAMLEAEKRTGARIIVTFNLRFAPLVTRIKELMSAGLVGTPLSVHFEWLLDTRHGADYFRRWHRKKENSGGLLIHKSTHHFDMVNWFIEDHPVTVSAFGTRRFYGPTRDKRGCRCLDCKFKDTCEFYIDLSEEEIYKELYLDCEANDGYFRDSCVFADEIDIEDNASVIVRYSKGTVMSYSLTAHSPYEGYKLNINGTDGRLEIEDYNGEAGPWSGKHIFKFRVYNRLGEEIDYKIPVPKGEHGGGDERLLKMLLDENLPDPLGHMAGSMDGAMSMLIGAAANISMAESRAVSIKGLLE